MNIALKKVKTTFINMSKGDIEKFLSVCGLSEFDKNVIRQKSLGTDNQTIMMQLNCTRNELFDSYERIAKILS